MNDRAIAKEAEITDVELKESDIVLPVNIDGMKKAWDRFQLVKKELLATDMVKYNKYGHIAEPGEPGKDYIIKSGWRKIATAFNLSIDMFIGEPKKINGEDGEGKYYTWLFPVRAIAPNGKYQDSWGACSSRKAFFSKKNKQRIDPQEEDIILMAQTVGVNRAISDLVGGGEVSGEEMIGKERSVLPTPIKQIANTNTQQPYDRSKEDPNAKPNTKINPNTNKPYTPKVARLYSLATKVYMMNNEDFKALCIKVTGKEHSKDYTNQDCWDIEDAMIKPIVEVEPEYTDIESVSQNELDIDYKDNIEHFEKTFDAVEVGKGKEYADKIVKNLKGK